MGIHVCETKCFHENRIWKPGERYVGNKAPKHFKKIDGKAGKVEEKTTGNLIAIKKVLERLDHKDDKLWTNKGEPQVKTIEKMVGFTTSRAEIEKAFPGFERDVTPLKNTQSPLTPSNLLG